MKKEEEGAGALMATETWAEAQCIIGGKFIVTAFTDTLDRLYGALRIARTLSLCTNLL